MGLFGLIEDWMQTFGSLVCSVANFANLLYLKTCFTRKWQNSRLSIQSEEPWDRFSVSLGKKTRNT